MDYTYFMQQALRLAGRGVGRVEPNPMVGAVLVRDGQIVARGYHQQFGGPHAEVEALQDARARGVDPSGCTLVVTLEPCCHVGKTPPCVATLLDARISKAVVAMADPNPVVDGKGIDQLRQAGVAVEVGVCEDRARRLNEPYLKRVTTGLPWVIAKWAQTLDGRIATQSGHSRWISNERSRRLAHQLRARVDAVVVGVGTVLADNPRLTARGVKLKRVARRVVVDPRLQIPGDARVLSEGDVSTLTLAVAADLYAEHPPKMVELAQRGVEFVGLPAWDRDSSRLAMEPLLRHLSQAHHATNVVVEGGAKLLGSLFQQRLVDQVLAFVSPKLFGDSQAVPPARGLSCPAVDQAQQLLLRGVRRVGGDVLLDYRVQASAAGASPGEGSTTTRLP